MCDLFDLIVLNADIVLYHEMRKQHHDVPNARSCRLTVRFQTAALPAVLCGFDFSLINLIHVLIGFLVLYLYLFNQLKTVDLSTILTKHVDFNNPSLLSQVGPMRNSIAKS